MLRRATYDPTVSKWPATAPNVLGIPCAPENSRNLAMRSTDDRESALWRRLAQMMIHAQTETLHARQHISQISADWDDIPDACFDTDHGVERPG
jgi:hypothetical protein